MGSRAIRSGYLALGLLALGLGLVGAVLPVMPSTIFFIVALWAFKRSSPRLEARLLERSPALRDWDRERSITRRTKLIAIGTIWITIGLSIALTVRKRGAEWESVLGGRGSFAAHPRLLVAPALFLIAVALTIFLATRKTKKSGT